MGDRTHEQTRGQVHERRANKTTERLSLKPYKINDMCPKTKTLITHLFVCISGLLQM